MNVAALGNQVPMLHVHIIARYKDDAAWPGPVWGHGVAEPYSNHARRELVTKLQRTPFVTDPARDHSAFGHRDGVYEHRLIIASLHSGPMRDRLVPPADMREFR